MYSWEACPRKWLSFSLVVGVQPAAVVNCKLYVVATGLRKGLGYRWPRLIGDGGLLPGKLQV